MTGSTESGAPPASDSLVVVGQLHGLHGVEGTFKVYSWTEPRENILQYEQWYLRDGGAWQAVERTWGKVHGKGLLARIRGIDDRNAAQAWLGAEVAVPRDALPEPEPGSWYWIDLIGCAVTTPDGHPLGEVTGLMETGAHDVLVTRQDGRERLIPLVPDDVIKTVDLRARTIVAQWHPED